VNQVIKTLADRNLELEGVNAPVLTRIVKALIADLESWATVDFGFLVWLP
jgi:hypothetical protein